MLNPGAYAREGLRQILTIDLGTAHVRIWSPALGRVVEEPTVVVWGPPGSRRAVGRAAVELADRTGAPLVWPLRHGVVDHFAACVHLLRVLTVTHAGSGAPHTPVLVGVPATATLRQQQRLTAAVRRATGGRVSTVEEPLAAALACRVGLDTEDLVVVDIGQGRTEVVRITDGTVTAAARTDGSNNVDQVPAIAAAVRRLGEHTHRPGPRRLLVTGGGAATIGVAARLAALTSRAVTMPADVRLATIQGLALLAQTRPPHPDRPGQPVA
ncbi:rod shape-determining protein [Micromonospora echinaurantiaca]|uniref:rod shape-determining protein n=1 Tax=Micromonospora echinaurantiaca TaxID=47857 RepID=UPI0037B2B57D